MQESLHFNPQDASKSIMMKSFLKSRDAKRDSGSDFFKDNRIRSCSFVKEVKGGLKAVPFYDKRNNIDYPTKSSITQSWNATVHSNKGILHAGMGSSKPLAKYDPSNQRNLIHIADFRPPYPNSSHIEIGNRSARDTKHYLTNYSNSHIKPQREVPTNHPGIQAFRNKWTRSRIQK